MCSLDRLATRRWFFWMEKFPLAAGFESLTKTSKRWWSKKCVIKKRFSDRNSWMLNTGYNSSKRCFKKKTTIQLVGKNERVSQHSATKPLRGCRLDISVAFVRSMSCLSMSQKKLRTNVGILNGSWIINNSEYEGTAFWLLFGEPFLNLKKQDWNPHFWYQFE